VDYLKEIARVGVERSKDYPDQSFRIRGLWRTDLLFKPNPAERTFDHTFLLVQTFGEGACYCSTIPDLEKGQYLLGQDCREVKHEYRCFEVATTDAMFSVFERHPDDRYCETGANLCEEYVRMGVDTAIAEPFPFYIFGGTTRIDIYRRKR